MVDSWGFGHFFTIAPRRCPWGYLRALSERWFHQSQSLHLMDCELVMTPLDWRYITGVSFLGPRVPLEPNISPAAVRSLLGFGSQDRVFKARSIRSGALAMDAIGGVFSDSFPRDRDIRDYLLRRLFLTIMRGCFLANNSSTIHFSVVGATRDVERIGDYDWGSFTFAYFLRGLRLRSEGQTDAWLGFYPFLLFWAFERLSCLRPITTLGPETYPRGRRWHHSTLEEIPVSDSFAHCRLQLELISSSDVTWVPYTVLQAGFDGFADAHEMVISTRRIPLLTCGGWELYLGDRAIRCVSGEVRIPSIPPSTRHWPMEARLSDDLMAGEDGFTLSDGPLTGDAFMTWWEPRTIGPQTRATFFLGDVVPGSVLMTEWMECFHVPTHSNQISSLTRQVDQLSLFIRELGRDPSEAFSRDPSGADHDTTPHSSGAPADGSSLFYCPDLNFGGETSGQAEGLNDSSFVDHLDFTD